MCKKEIHCSLESREREGEIKGGEEGKMKVEGGWFMAYKTLQCMLCMLNMDVD